MTKRIALLFAAALGLLAGAARAADSLTMDDFAHSIRLQVNGYTGTETLVNFPVLVRVDNIDGFQYNDMSDPTQGRDMAFFGENGEHLASEIDTWRDSNSKKSLVWVKLPAMTRGTKFFMCFNTSESGAMVTNQNPWTDYVGVWHMRETGNANATIADSTTNHLDGVALAAASCAGVRPVSGFVAVAARDALSATDATAFCVSRCDSANCCCNEFICSLFCCCMDAICCCIDCNCCCNAVLFCCAAAAAAAAFADCLFCAAIESDTNCAAIAFIKSSPCFLHAEVEFTHPATIGFAISIFAQPPPEHLGDAQRKINELQFPKSAVAVAVPALLRGLIALFH